MPETAPEAPKEGAKEGELERLEEPAEARGRQAPEEDSAGGPFQGDMSSSSLSAQRMRYESERDASRASRKAQRTSGPPANRPAASDIPVDPDGLPNMDLDEPEWDPEIHDYHQSQPRRQLSPMAESPEEEAQEREAKRLRSSANYVRETCDAYSAATQPDYLNNKAKEHYYKHEAAYLSKGVEMSDFMFGVRRNHFQDRDEALAASDGKGGKKKGRKELNLKELSSEQQLLFTGQGGSDAKEWSAWLSKEACEVLDMKESEDIRRNKADLIVPTRWVGTNKNDGLVDKDFLAKSRLVVQGFKDRSWGTIGEMPRQPPRSPSQSVWQWRLITTSCCWQRTSRMPTLVARVWAGRFTSNHREEASWSSAGAIAEGQESYLWLFGGSPSVLAGLEGAP